MNALVIASRKTYSLSNKKPINEWKTAPIDGLKLMCPHNFDTRVVDADLYNKSLEQEFFNELRLNWKDTCKVKELAKTLFTDSLTDIAVYIEELRVGLVVKSHSSCPGRIVIAQSLDVLKKELKLYAARQNRQVL